MEHKESKVREAALRRLVDRTDQEAWTILLLSYDNSFEDTRRKIQLLIGKRLREHTGFKRYVDHLANQPAGLVSAIAFSVLVSNRLTGSAQIKNYRNSVKQHLAASKHYFILKPLEENIKSAGEWALYTLQAARMMEIYAGLALTNAPELEYRVKTTANCRPSGKRQMNSLNIHFVD